MASSRDDFIIAIRSAFLKKSTQQKFSLLTLVFLSIFVIILSNLDFKVVRYLKIGINELVYRSSFIVSIPENFVKNTFYEISDYTTYFKDYKKQMGEEEKVDYLEVDDPIPGQNFVCLSFLSPEKLIQEKEVFKVAKFLQSYCKDKKLNFNKVFEEYKDFTYKYASNLQKDFDEANKFQTNVRGIKVRGVYESREAAEKRAKKLQNTDSDFSVFVG